MASGGGDASVQPINDPVTGAYSRALLQPRLEGELARAERSAGSCALFMFDVDFFKSVNDSYGHLRGDEILRQLTERVRALVRRSDELFRYGGDEFVLLLPHTTRAEAVRLALDLTEAIRGHEFPGDPPLHVSVSLGVAAYPEDGTDPTTLLARADRRNYLAKGRGRGGVVADDADTAGGPRLWERDAALAAAHDFLTRLQVGGSGALRVTGPAGAGHTRFLDHVGHIAKLRGFDVLTVPAGPSWEPPAATGTEVVLIADVDAAGSAAAAVDRLAAAEHPPEVLGLVYASTDGSPDPYTDTDGSPGGYASTDGSTGSAGRTWALPRIGTAELTPWSPAALRIWLRTTLRGEPSRALVSWLAGQSGGLPARAVRELDRLRARGGLTAGEDGRWTVAATAMGRLRLRTQLPVPMTPLVGREPERAQVIRMLADNRLVTLVGPGGIGKTRLALSVAAAVAEDFDDGAIFVPLAETTGASLVVAAIARALRVGEEPGQPLLDTVVEHLADASLLLVLDNFEQVVVAAEVVGAILAAAPGVTALVTSREPLSRHGERLYRVPPLLVPDLGRLPDSASGVGRAVAGSPALALFDQRARAADADFAVSPETLPAVVALCRRLDGLPLAIELAAARVDRLTPQALLADLTGHLDELGEGPRDLPARQRTLRGAIDWSFALLDKDDQTLFTRLAVFAGGCTIDGAAAVAPTHDGAGPCGGGPREGCDDLAARLAALADKSLLVVEEDPAGGTRYRMLETIRAYAVAQLAAQADADAVHARHAGYFLAFAERSADGLAGPEQAAWAGRIEREYQNLQSAFASAVARGEVDMAARFCLGLWRYWRNSGHLREGRDWLDQVLAAPTPLGDEVRARVLHAAAVLAATQDDHEPAYRLAVESLYHAEAAGDRQAVAQACNALGMAATGRGDYQQAVRQYRRSLAIWRELGQPQGTAIALGNLTKVALRIGDVAGANDYADECLRLERAAGNSRGIALGLECLAQILLARRDVAGARRAVQESLALSRALGDVFGEAMALHQMGQAAALAGDAPAALRLYVDALARRHELGDREDLAVSLDSVAALLATGNPAESAHLLGAADALRERHRLPVPPDSETERADTLAAAIDALGPDAFDEHWSAGRATSLDLVVERLLDLVPLA